MKQVTGLTVLLQEPQCFNSIFIPLDEFAQRLEPKYLPFASKISLKKQFFLELNICTSHSVLNMQHGSLEVMLCQEVQLLDNWLYKTKNLK